MRRAGALALLVLALAACGGAGTKGAAPVESGLSAAPVKHAAVKTAEAASEHVVVTATATVSGTSTTVNGSGDFDNRTRRGNFHASLGVAGINAEIDEVMDGTTIYMRSPLLSTTLPAGKSWIKVDLQRYGKAHGIDFSALLGQSPAQALAQVEAAGGVTKVGEETVGGVSTTHYRGHVDVSKLPQGAQVEALTHAKYGPLDIWIGNDDGLVHRYRETVTIKQNGTSVTTATTADFSKYGEPVTVNVPPASATIDSTGSALGGITF